MFIKQCKGTDSDKMQLPHIWDNWYSSIKYDGHYMQVNKSNRGIIFYTSSGKPFIEDNLVAEFAKFPDGVYECEFLGYGDGKHGGRKDAAFATTLRTNYAKKIKCNYPGLKCVVFDIIMPGTFFDRLATIKALPSSDNVKIVEYQSLACFGPEAILSAELARGWEGIYLKHISHIHYPGKRVKNAIKMKAHHTADVKCIGIEEGEGKYQGHIGSLICVDENGIEVKVGSGLTDADRKLSDDYFIGKTIEIAYESFSDTYIHPIYKGIRSDK